MFKGLFIPAVCYSGQLSNVLLKKTLLMHIMCSFTPKQRSLSPKGVSLAIFLNRIALLLHLLMILRWTIEESDCRDLKK